MPLSRKIGSNFDNLNIDIFVFEPTASLPGRIRARADQRVTLQALGAAAESLVFARCPPLVEARLGEKRDADL